MRRSCEHKTWGHVTGCQGLLSLTPDGCPESYDFNFYAFPKHDRVNKELSQTSKTITPQKIERIKICNSSKKPELSINRSKERLDKDRCFFDLKGRKKLQRPGMMHSRGARGGCRPLRQPTLVLRYPCRAPSLWFLCSERPQVAVTKYSPKLFSGNL